MIRFNYALLALLVLAIFAFCIWLSFRADRGINSCTGFNNCTDEGDAVLRATGSCERRSKIAVVMWWDAGIDAYARLAWKINCAYGQSHGIDVIRSSKSRDARGALWERVKLMLEYLDDYDYVMWCDADAAFNVRSQSLRAFLSSHGDPDAILSEDIPASWASYRDGKMGLLSDSELLESNLNSGVVIVRNSAAGKRLLQLWDRSEGFSGVDQTPLRYIYHLYLKGAEPELGRVVKAPYGLLQVFPADAADALAPRSSEPLIFHQAGQHHGARVRFFTQMFPTSAQALSQTLFYLEPYQSTNQYDQELRRGFEASWRRVDATEQADVKVLLVSDERNYPNFRGDGGPGMTINLKSHIEGLKDESGAAVLTFDLNSAWALPRNTINVVFSRASESDIVVAPPALMDRTPPVDGSVDRPLLASFKGRRSRVNRSKRDVRAESFDALLAFHDGTAVVVCDDTDSRYDYDDLLKKSTFAFILEGDLPWSYRLTEAVLHGCIPFFIQQDFTTLPHEDLVSWDEMCLRLPLSRAREARATAEAALASAPLMQAALRRYYSERLQTRALEVEAIMATHSLRYGLAGRVAALTDVLGRLPPIPKKIHVAWKRKDFLDSAASFAIVKHGVRALRDLNPSWSLEISDDADVEEYLRRCLSEEDYASLRSKHIVEKVDLWSLLKVYREGGCYSDVDRIHNRSLDAALLPTTHLYLPTWEDLNASQDILISAPGAPHLARAIELNLRGRREGSGLYELGPRVYWAAATQFVLGHPIFHERASPYIFSKFRAILEACRHTQTFREAPFKTLTYEGPVLDLDKHLFYQAAGVKPRGE